MSTDDVSVERPLVASLWSMVGVSGVFVALKILARSRRRMLLWWDDYLMLMAWICLVAASVVLTDATVHGLGRHVRYLSRDERSTVLRLGYIAAVLTIAASVWSKVSFALFLLRISSSGCTEWTRRGILGIIISLNLMFVTAISLILVSCRPTKKTWMPDIEGTCLDDNVKVVGTVVLAVYSGIADLILALLPWKIIWCLPVRRRDKIGLVAVMNLGVFAAIASFIKSAQVHLMVTEDFSFDGWTLVLWAILEPTVTIIATSVPVIRTFVRDLARSLSRRRVSCSVDSEGQQRTSDPSASTANRESTSRRLPCVSDKERVILAELNVDAEYEEPKTEGSQGEDT